MKKTHFVLISSVSSNCFCSLSVVSLKSNERFIFRRVQRIVARRGGGLARDERPPPLLIGSVGTPLYDLLQIIYLVNSHKTDFFFLRKDLFSFMRAQHVLGYHLRKLLWMKHLQHLPAPHVKLKCPGVKIRVLKNFLGILNQN